MEAQTLTTVAAQPVRARPRAERWRAGVDEMAGMLRLAVRSAACWVTPPFSWWREAVEQGWLLVQRCALPAIISTFAFGYGAPGIESTSIGERFGFTDRVGTVFSVASLREFAPWVAGMVVAGVAGTAITADLGARKIRDELDALAVMGVDAVRTLVAPRILALMLIMPAITVVSLVIAALAGVIAVVQFGGTAAGYFETFQAHFTVPDLVANTLKTVVFGFLIALICAYKGMHAKGGSEGVGRAVNQAVVMAFVAVWIFNFAFNSTYQAAFPSAQEFR